jgi:hypothetical protein
MDAEDATAAGYPKGTFIMNGLKTAGPARLYALWGGEEEVEIFDFLICRRRKDLRLDV